MYIHKCQFLKTTIMLIFYSSILGCNSVEYLNNTSSQKVTIISTQETSLPVALNDKLTQFPIIPTRTEVPTPTPIPVKTPNEKELPLLFEYLNTNSCDLPCFLNIHTGVTKWEEAKSILENIGAVFNGKDLLEPGESYSFTIYFMKEHYSFVLTISENIVQRIFIKTYNNRNAAFYDNWAKYSFFNTLKHLGKPDEIVLNIYYDFHSYAITMLYKKQKMSLKWTGDMKHESKWLVCPALISDKTWNFDFSISNPKSNYGLFTNINGTVTPNNKKVWHSISDTFGINEETFFNMIMSDPNSCFTAYWPK